MTDQIEWGDPPNEGRGGPVWPAILDEFRKHPGKWGKVPGRRSASSGTYIRRGIVAGADAGEFEARTANQKDGKADIWIRYVGEVTS